MTDLRSTDACAIVGEVKTTLKPCFLGCTMGIVMSTLQNPRQRIGAKYMEVIVIITVD